MIVIEESMFDALFDDFGREMKLDAVETLEQHPGQPAAKNRCRACDQIRADVVALPDALPLCAQCAKAHRMGYRCGVDAAVTAIDETIEGLNYGHSRPSHMTQGAKVARMAVADLMKVPKR